MPSESTKASLERASREYAAILADTPDVLEYLTTTRRITKDAVEEFRLGYTGNNPRVGDPARRISIPYLSASGVVQIRFRSLDPDPGEFKYLGVKGVPTTLYNTRILVESHPTIYITEGEIDCITSSICDLPTIGVPGAKSWRRYYARALRYREVVVLADAGEAGKKLADAISGDVPDCKIVVMPEDDVNYHYCQYGKEGVRSLVGLSG